MNKRTSDKIKKANWLRDGTRCLVLPIAKVLHDEFKMPILKKLSPSDLFVFYGVLDDYFDDQAYLPVEPESADFIHDCAKRSENI